MASRRSAIRPAESARRSRRIGAPHNLKMALAPGSRLGSYDILEPLGAGGMGEVYRASDSKLGREVAVKILPSEFANDP